MIGQGLAHQLLRSELKAAAQNLPGYNAANSIILFTFRADDDSADGIAARVYVMRDTGTTDTLESSRYVTQARKRADNLTSTSPTTEELKARIRAGEGRESVVHANASYVSWSDMTGQTMHMPRMERYGRWDLEDAMENAMKDNAKLGHPNGTVRAEADKAGSVQTRDPGPRSISEHNVTPLLKRATAQDLQAARTIVNNALAESSKLNEARVAAPLRNSYGLKPGTVVGVPGAGGDDDDGSASINQDVPPLLVITDQIAAAAALVAEADAIAGSRNVTKRAAATAGTYWMQRWVFPTKYPIFHQRTPC